MSQPSSPTASATAAGGANDSAAAAAAAAAAADADAAFVESMLNQDSNIKHTNISREELIAPIDADGTVMTDATSPPSAVELVVTKEVAAVDSEIPPSTADQVETTSVALTQQQDIIASQQLSVCEKVSSPEVEPELELVASSSSSPAAAAATEQKEEPQVEQPSSPSFSASDSDMSRSSSSLSHSSRSASNADHPVSPSISADSSSQSAMEEEQSVQRSDSASSSSNASEEESNLQLPSQASSVLSQPVFQAAPRAVSIASSQQLNRTSSNAVEERTSSQLQQLPALPAVADEADLPATQPQSSHEDSSSRTPLFGPSLRVDAAFNRTFSGRSFAPDAPFMPVKPLQLIKEQSVEESAAEADAESESEQIAHATMAEQPVPQVEAVPDVPQVEQMQDVQSQPHEVVVTAELMSDVAAIDPLISSSVSRSASVAEVQFHDRLVSREPSRAASTFNPFETQESQQLLIETDQSVPIEEDKEPTAEIVPLLANCEASNSIIAPVDANTDSVGQVNDISDIPVEESLVEKSDNRLARVESVAMEFTQTVSAPIQLMQSANVSESEPLAEEMADIAEDNGEAQDQQIQARSEPTAVEKVTSQPPDLPSESNSESNAEAELESEQSVPIVGSEFTANQEETPSPQAAPAEEPPAIAESMLETSCVEAAPFVETEVVNSISVEAQGELQEVCVEIPSAAAELSEAQPMQSATAQDSASILAPCDIPITSNSEHVSQTQVSTSQKGDEQQDVSSQQQVVAQEVEQAQPEPSTMDTQADATTCVNQVVVSEVAVDAPMEVLDAAPTVDSSIIAETAPIETPIATVEAGAEQQEAEEDVLITEASVTESNINNCENRVDIPAVDITPVEGVSLRAPVESVSILTTSEEDQSQVHMTEVQPEGVAQAVADDSVAESSEQISAPDATVQGEVAMEALPESGELASEILAVPEAVPEAIIAEPTSSHKEMELTAELDALRIRFDEQAKELKTAQSEVQAARESESTVRNEWSTKQAHFESLIAEFDANQLAASNSFQSQLHTAQADSTRLSAAHQQLSQQLASAHERLSTSEASATQFESEVKSLSNQLATAQDESVKLQSDVGSLMSALESKNAACESHAKELRENAVELQQLRLQATPTQHLIEARDLEIKTKVSELNDKAEVIKRLKSRIDELEEEAKSNQLESKKLQKKNSTLESTNEELQEQVKTLPSIEAQLSSTRSKLQSFETEMNQLRDSLKAESTKSEAAEIRSVAERLAAKELEDQAKSLSQRLLNSEKEVTQSESKIAELSSANTELMSKVALLEEKEKAHHASSTAIKNAIETYRAQKSQLMKENKQFTEQVAQLQAQLAKTPTHKVQLDELTKLQADLQEKHDALDKECASLRKQVSDLSTVKAEKEFEIQALRKSEREQRRKIEASEEKLEEIKDKLVEAEKKLNEPKPHSAAIAIPESNSPPVESIQNSSSDAVSSKTSRRRLQLELTTSEPEPTPAPASNEEKPITIHDETIAQEPATAASNAASNAKESKERKEEFKEAPAADSENGTSGRKVLRVRGKTNAEKEKEAALQAKAEKEREDKELAAALAASLADSVPADGATNAACIEVDPAVVSTRSSSHGSSDSESKKSTSRKKQLLVKDSIASMEVEQTVAVTTADASVPSESTELVSESSKTKPSRKRKSGSDDEQAKAKEEPAALAEEKTADSAPSTSHKLSAKDAFRLKQSKGKAASASGATTSSAKEEAMDTSNGETTADVHVSVASLSTPSTKKKTSKSPTMPPATEEKEKEQKEQQVEEQKTAADEVDSADKDEGSARKKRRTSRVSAGGTRNIDTESDVKLSSIQSPVIMFSGFKPGTVNNLEQLATLQEGAKKLGATIASDKSDWNQITHCVAPKASTTEKALGACLKHKFVCEPEWLLYSIAAGQFLDEITAQGNSYATEPFKGKTYSILSADFEKKPERIGLATRLVQLGEGTIIPFADEEDCLQLLDGILSEPKGNHRSLSAVAQSKLLAFEKFMSLIPSYQSKSDSSNSSNASTTGSERKAKRKASEEESKEAPASASSKRTSSNGSVKEVTLDKENVSMSTSNIQASIADLTPANKGGEKKKQRKAGSVASEPATTSMETDESDKDKKKKNKRSIKNEDDSEEMSASQPKPTTRQTRNLRV